MSEIESKLKERNDLIIELFNFKGDDSKHKHIKELFINFIKNSENCPIFFIDLLNFYSECQPLRQQICKEPNECVYSHFPQQLDKIQEYIKNTDRLKLSFFQAHETKNKQKCVHFFKKRS